MGKLLNSFGSRNEQVTELEYADQIISNPPTPVEKVFRFIVDKIY